ncbi:DNA polymerase III subunit delta [Vibrio diazotrophicus]|uniref:DNA polymerase III subunit delta n=1 Tax=Vibrio diazotrophicus TaxID=685 RepID=UPI0005A80ECF|nr:DNA polymerase III subunit delta [Vibrio diazotrophicus]
MRVYADKLADSLQRSLLPVYLIFGGEPLLTQESVKAIENKALSEGFEEKHHFTVDNNLDWTQVYDCCQSLSLFSSRQIIVLEIAESGLNAALSKSLATVADYLNPDIVLIVMGNKLTKAQENTAWFKALMANGCLVNCLTPELSRLPQFVMARCRTLGLTPDAEAVQMLAQWHEGNLFALMQSLQKLALNYPDGQLTLIRLQESLDRHNHFTPFHWMDALLEGKANRAQRILRQLEAEAIEPIILMRTLQKELFLLLQMKQQLNTIGIGAVFDKHRVWQNKRPLYSAALQRLSLSKLQHLIRLLAQIEVLAKTQYEQPCWPLLHQLSVEFAVPQANIPLPV